ncbi:MAG: aldehyde dehydrogenase family protein [Bradymonadia bacterium]
MTHPYLDDFRGHFINGRFEPSAGGQTFVSRNPAHGHQPVLEVVADVGAVDRAVTAARSALRGWRGAGLEGRIEALKAVRDKVGDHAERIAEAITAEMGKTRNEALIEARSIAGKIDGVISQIGHALPPAGPGAPGEQRFHALGVVAIIGPFNFPVHLVNTHVIPALLTGNTVVAKPSEVTPLAGQRYAELFEAAGFPAGVFNLVHGLGDTGAALVSHSGVRGVIFTGSYRTGRLIRQATFDQPYKKVCLELGGKNPALVLDDADLEQAAREIMLGALLTTGQRCTATSRVIVTPGAADGLRDRLVQAFGRIKPGDPAGDTTFMGPLANEASKTRFLDLLQKGREEGAQVLVESESLDGGAFVTPSLYEVKGHERLLHEELFGPHVAFEVAQSEDDAFARGGENTYGLSASLFSARPEAFERFYDEIPAGVLNFNRSTNGASGLLSFGGVGMSGNWRPAGAMAPRLCTYPVAVMQVPFGQITAHGNLDRALGLDEKGGQ